MIITLFLFSELTPINRLRSTEYEYYSLRLHMQIVTAIDLTKSQENVATLSIRFERLKGKNLGYPQRCAHSL
jgi:hypothetical protein